MAHNPIKSQQTAGFFTGLQVHINEVGVLYKNQRFERLIRPGDSLRWGDLLRFSSYTVYIVDIAPHPLAWRASLPAQGSRDHFSLTINLNYRVADPRRMVEDQVKDTEAKIVRVLEPLLSKVSRSFKLNQYVELDAAVEDAIQKADLPALSGLDLVDPADVRIDLSEETLQRIKILDELDRAMRVVRTAEHTIDVPSRAPADKFQVAVYFSYRVSKPDELPSDSLEEAERQLWPRLRSILRRAGRRHRLIDIVQADAAMQDALDRLLDEDGIEGFGLKVESVEISTDLGDAARQRYVELANEEHKVKLEDLKRVGLKAGADFYTDLVRQGNWAVLALAVFKGEITTEELSERLTQQQQEIFNRQFGLLKTLREVDMRDEKQDYELSKIVLGKVADTVLGPQMPALPSPEPARDAAEEAETPSDEEKEVK